MKGIGIVKSVILLLGSQKDCVFMYAGAVAGAAMEKENMSTAEGVAKDRSKLVSIGPGWEEKKSSSFCIVSSTIHCARLVV